MGELHVGEDIECETLFWKHVFAEVDAAVFKCAIKLQLFDAMHSLGGGCSQPISLSDLAASLSLPSHRSSTLRRIMRYLSHMSLVTIHREAPDAQETETYTLTPTASTYLTEASEKSHNAYLKFLYNWEWLSVQHQLDTCFAPEEIPGYQTAFECFEKDPKQQGKMFNDAMECTARPIAEAVVRGCPKVFEGVRTLVDVGGGNGIMVSAIARAFPKIKCAVYDLGYTLANSPKHDGILYQAGDMFVSVPKADALLLCRVLHDWNDDKGLDILKKCREAIFEENGKLIIVDIVLDENDNKDIQHIKLGFDILMMTTTGGKERTEKEWRSLLLKADFNSCSFNKVMAFFHVIEARP